MNEEEFFDALEYAFKNEEVCRGGRRGMVSRRVMLPAFRK